MRLVDGTIPVFGEADEKTLTQIRRCALTADKVALMPDNHLGYGVPIGGVVAYKDAISPTGVGYDIGCGNKAVRVDMSGSDLRANIKTIMDDIWKTISFGIGQKNNERTDACSECGFVWTQPERGYDRYNEIMNHMVEKHGYKRVGSQVFRSTVCAGPGCKKPGLYKANMSGYTFCSDHKQLAVDRCFLRTLRLDKGRNETDLNLNAEDARMRSLDSSHSLTKANRKLSGR